MRKEDAELKKKATEKIDKKGLTLNEKGTYK